MNVKTENQGDFLFFRCFEKTKMVPFSRFCFQYYIKKRMNATYTDHLTNKLYFSHVLNVFGTFKRKYLRMLQ